MLRGKLVFKVDGKVVYEVKKGDIEYWLFDETSYRLMIALSYGGTWAGSVRHCLPLLAAPKTLAARRDRHFGRCDRRTRDSYRWLPRTSRHGLKERTAACFKFPLGMACMAVQD